MIRTKLYNFILSAISLQLVFITGQFSFVAVTHAQEVTREAEIIVEPRLIISAVQITGGTGHTQEDFIELYNPTGEPFDLNGHRLVKRTATATTDSVIKSWTEPTVVEGHHFYLWANSSFSSLPLAADSTSTATVADNNGIALREGENDLGVIVDDIAWGDTANGFDSVSAQNPGANESLLRTDLFDDPASFEINRSNPRNSSVIENPPGDNPPEDSPPDDEPPSEDPPPDPPADIEIEITELYPNPSGSDSGFEQIELYNSGSETVLLEGFKMDDVSPSDSLSSNAYILPDLDIAPDSYLAIKIPAGKFSLNNTGGDVVTLFDTFGEVIVSASYTESTPEAKSFSLFDDNEWLWTTPTLGEANGLPPDPEEEELEEDEGEEESIDYGDYDNSGLQISEIYSTPKTGSSEFIELYNDGEEIAQLAVVSLWVGERHKLLPEFELKPGEYYSVEQAALPVQLRNSGQVIKLMEENNQLDTITYPALAEANSYARFEDGFLLTTYVTKNAANILQLPEVVKKEVAAAAAKTTVAKTTPKASTKAPAKKPATTTVKAAVKSPAVAGLTTNNVNTNSELLPADKAAQDKKDSVGKIIAMGAAAAAAGVVALYKLVFSAGVE